MDLLAWLGIAIAFGTLAINTFFNTAKSDNKPVRKKVSLPGYLVFFFGVAGLVLTIVVQYRKSDKEEQAKREITQKAKEDSIRHFYQQRIDSTISADLKTELRYSDELLRTTNALNEELVLRLKRQSNDLKSQKEEIIKSRFLIEEDRLSMDVEFLFTSATLLDILSTEENAHFSVFRSSKFDTLQISGNVDIAEQVLTYLKNFQIKLDFIKGPKDNFFSLLSKEDIVLNNHKVNRNDDRDYVVQIYPTKYRDAIYVHLRNLPLRVWSKNYTFQVLQDFDKNVMTVGITSDSLRPYQENILEPPSDEPYYLALPIFRNLDASDRVYYLLSSTRMNHRYNTVVYEKNFKKSNERRFQGHFISNTYEFLLQDSLMTK